MFYVLPITKYVNELYHYAHSDLLEEFKEERERSKEPQSISMHYELLLSSLP